MFSKGDSSEFRGKHCWINKLSLPLSLVVFWNLRTGCTDTLITLSLEVKALMKYFKSNNVYCSVLPHSPV